MGITIVGMGSAQGVEPQVLERLKGCAEILLQTQAYPGFRGIQEAVGGRYLDELYESSQNFAAFNDRVVRMALEAAEKGEVALCVAGDGAGNRRYQSFTTREEAVQMFYRYSQLPPQDTSAPVAEEA